MHHVGVVFTREDVAGSAHVGRKLIYFVEAAIDYMFDEVGIAKITDYEVISLCLAEPWKFEIDASDPEAFPLEPPD